MQRREFITAAVGMTAAVASASQAFAQQDYPDFGAIKKMPVGEGAAGHENCRRIVNGAEPGGFADLWRTLTAARPSPFVFRAIHGVE